MFLILVVLYNKSIDSSKTLSGLTAAADCINAQGNEIYIWDNSLHQLNGHQINSLKSTFQQFVYNHCPQNLHLSAVYNKAIEHLLQSQNKYLVLLDDDTSITENFFNEIAVVANTQQNIDLMLPQIICNNVVVSPSKYFYGHGSFIQHVQTGPVKSTHKMAINSGMVISKKYLTATGFKYLSALRNYATDNYFMQQYAQMNEWLYILNEKIEHSLSLYDQDTSVEKKIANYKEISRGLKLVHPYSLFLRLLLFKNKLTLALKYKDFSIFR